MRDPAGSKQADFDGEAYEVGAVVKVQLAADARSVGLNGLDAEEEAIRHDLVGVPRGEQFKDPAFLLAQLLQSANAIATINGIARDRLD